jgi:hypothetical protein
MTVELPLKLPNQAFALPAQRITCRKLRSDSLKSRAISCVGALLAAEKTGLEVHFFPAWDCETYKRNHKALRKMGSRFVDGYKVKWMRKRD